MWHLYLLFSFAYIMPGVIFHALLSRWNWSEDEAIPMSIFWLPVVPIVAIVFVLYKLHGKIAGHR